MKHITPIIQEIDLKLREIESGKLSEAEKINQTESVCRTLRGHLRAEYGLEAANNLKGLTSSERTA